MPRLILLIILFLISLLTIFKAFQYHLWLLAIGVTEFSWLFILITLVLLATGIWVNKYQLEGTLVGVITLVLFLSPYIRAYNVGNSLKNNFDTAFGNKAGLSSNNDRSPFSIFRLFSVDKPIASKTFIYVTYPDTTMSLDYYPAQVSGKKPCVIVIHGGSWSSGDSRQLAELNSYLARRGYNVASINYRLAPKYQSPAPVTDVQAALNYLHKHAEELKIDTGNFILLGRSAGAQIALLAAYTLHNAGIKGVIDFYGPADMVWGYSVPSSPLIMDSRGVMEAYLGGSYHKVPQNYASGSPLAFVDKTTVPTLIIHGYNDVLVAYEHSRCLNEKLQQNGIKHYWLRLPWATHGFDYNLNGPGGQLSTYAVERFLNAICPAGPK
ncbi:MAG TPA: alpha/beta hydrolase [Mucilaginibacter sp.]|jgi:acetyl esterase/lipase|nr:alpha/beta hydrolase [Mucilaginibacter sp.]